MLPCAADSITEDSIASRLAQQMLLLDPALHPEDVDIARAFGVLRPASVLVPLLWIDNQWHVLYTRRTERVQSHKGQVSFPGGGAEPQDASPEETALREAYEEIGLPPEDVRILGRLSGRPTISSFLVTPVVGRILRLNPYQLSPDEVDRVFTIPLCWLANPANREERPRTIQPGLSVNVVYFQPYDGEIVWGATGRITVDLLRALGLFVE